jgi:hypothetical protein
MSLKSLESSIARRLIPSSEHGFFQLLCIILQSLSEEYVLQICSENHRLPLPLVRLRALKYGELDAYLSSSRVLFRDAMSPILTNIGRVWKHVKCILLLIR